MNVTCTHCHLRGYQYFRLSASPNPSEIPISGGNFGLNHAWLGLPIFDMRPWPRLPPLQNPDFWVRREKINISSTEVSFTRLSTASQCLLYTNKHTVIYQQFPSWPADHISIWRHCQVRTGHPRVRWFFCYAAIRLWSACDCGTKMKIEICVFGEGRCDAWIWGWAENPKSGGVRIRGSWVPKNGLVTLIVCSLFIYNFCAKIIWLLCC